MRLSQFEFFSETLNTVNNSKKSFELLNFIFATALHISSIVEGREQIL